MMTSRKFHAFLLSIWLLQNNLIFQYDDETTLCLLGTPMRHFRQKRDICVVDRRQYRPQSITVANILDLTREQIKSHGGFRGRAGAFDNAPLYPHNFSSDRWHSFC